MATRSYNRRSSEEIIADLQSEINRQKAKIEARAKSSDPVLCEIPKIQKRLRKFAQIAHDGDRKQIANAVTAFVSSLERMYKQG